MLILQVELDNIKSYEHATVDFAPGVNAIVGHNGAGKSTILEAIGFALFDSLAYKASDFLREGTRTGTVAVTFVGSLDERPYRVERRVGGSHLYVVFDVELQAKLCEGKTDVLTFVRRQIGADPTIDLSRLFADAVGVPQGTLTAAFLQQPSPRKVIFDALLQVDEYRTAVDKLREPRTLLAERQASLAQAMAVLSARLERLPQLQTAVAERTGELQRIAQTLAARHTKLETVAARKAALDALRGEIDDLDRKYSREAQNTQTLAAQLSEAQRQLSAAEQARDTVAANLPGHDRYAAASLRRGELDERARRRQALREGRAAADKQLALAQSELLRTAEQLTRIAAAEARAAELAPAVAQQAALERELAAAGAERARLQEAARQLAAERKQLAALQARGEQIAAQLAEADARQAELQELEQRLAEQRTAVTQHSEALGTLQASANELKAQNETLEAVHPINSATANCPVCEQPLSAEHRRRVVARNEERLQELRRQYAGARQQITAAEIHIKELTAGQKTLSEHLRSLPRAAELDDIRRRIAAAEEAVAAAAGAETGAAAAEVKAAELTTQLAALHNPREAAAVAAQLAAERPAAAASQGKLQQQQAAAGGQLAELDAALAAFAELDRELAEVQGALQEHQAAFQAVLTFRQAADALPQRAGDVERLQTAAAAAAETLAAALRRLQSLQAQFDPVEYAGILSEDQVLRSETAALQTRQGLYEQERSRAQEEIAALQALQAELAELTAATVGVSRQEAVLETVRTLLRQSGPYITQALIRQISAAANQIFGELMQDFSRELRWSEDYGITLEVQGASRQFVQLSGGEQMSAALAVRLALVREISNIDIAFFDEPTANLDDVRREALARQVMNIRGFRQLFVISHDDTFEQVTQNLVRVKRHGSSSIVAATES